MLKDEDKSANFLGALRGHAKFPLITFSSLEDQPHRKTPLYSLNAWIRSALPVAAFSLFLVRYEINEGH